MIINIYPFINDNRININELYLVRLIIMCNILNLGFILLFGLL